MTTTIRAKQINWRQASGYSVASATVWGAGPERGGRRTERLEIRLALHPDGGYVLAVTVPSNPETGKPEFLSTRQGTRAGALAELPSLLEQAATKVEAGYASEGQRMPGCMAPVPVKAETVTTN